MEQDFFEIGIITKPQGIKGELRVLPTTDDPWRFELLIGEKVFLRRDGSPDETFELVAARVQKGMVYLKLEGIHSRDAVEKLVGAVIAIPPGLALPLRDDEYYVRDLVGLRAEDESGDLLGEIAHVVHTPANDIYEIEQSDGKRFLVPAVKEFVQSVDMNEGKIVLRLIEGLR